MLRLKYTIFMCGHFHKCRSTLHFCVQNSLCTYRQTGQVGFEKNDAHIISKASYFMIVQDLVICKCKVFQIRINVR